MKVGIVTLFGDNYGNKLQNYAMQVLLTHIGCHSETIRIDYGENYLHKETIFDDLQKLNPSHINSVLRARQNNKVKIPEVLIRKRAEAFQEFSDEYINVSDIRLDARFNDYDSRLEKFDYFVTGSDQVWNRTKSPYFLTFAPEEKRVAVSPSFGISKLPEYLKKEYKNWISQIPHLSVREKSGVAIIKELTGKTAEVLPDPTLCVDKDVWENIEKQPKPYGGQKYVFTYFLGNESEDHRKCAAEYAKTIDAEIIHLNSPADSEFYTANPSEFLWLIHHAEAVFTDSFHGTVFSIIYNTPFVVFDRIDNAMKVMGDRLETLLQLTEFEDRKYSEDLMANIFNIDFTHSNETIKYEQSRMIDYLNRSIIKTQKDSETGIVLAPKRKCTGCGACYNVCPKNAISMKADEEGFLYPMIDKEKCINCKACEIICPADKVKPSAEQTKIYYAFSKDKEICEKSSSGGIFTELARQVIANKGLVYGAGYDSDFNVCHQSVNTFEAVQNLRTSKYVQSDIRESFRDIKKNLQRGTQVLFSGTPCQVVPLKKYLQKDYEHLITVDIICHGVPSPGLWKEYLKEYHDKPIRSISFRDKTVGWNDFSMRVVYMDGTEYRVLAKKDPFERAFLSNITLRPSCYQCQYKTVERASDITIADYWGVEVVHPELKEQQGVSLVLIHSDKGEKLFDEIKEYICYGATDDKRAVSMNSAATKSVPWTDKRNIFFDLKKTHSFGESVKISLKPTMVESTRALIVKNGVKVKRVLRKIGVLK